MGALLYSTNPWLATDIATRYRNHRHFSWCCEFFDITKAPAGSAAAMIAPSSNPKHIYERLHRDVGGEDQHSDLIKNYRKTFKRLSTAWLSAGELDATQRDEILDTMRPGSWRIWRPVLYLIPREPIERAGRLLKVPRGARAGHGPELQIEALLPHEFDIVELT